MNNITLVGRVTKDTEIRTIKGSENKIAYFTIAVNRKYKRKNGDSITDFIPVEVGNNSAEFCERNFKKGRLVSVVGSLEIDQLEDKRYTKVNAIEVTPLDKKKETFEQIPSEDVPFDN